MRLTFVEYVRVLCGMPKDGIVKPPRPPKRSTKKLFKNRERNRRRVRWDGGRFVKHQNAHYQNFTGVRRSP